MENGSLVALSRLSALRRSLDVTANNVANMNTGGFKADGTLFEEFLISPAREGNFTGNDRRVSFVQDRTNWTDMRAGSLQQTGNPLDVAVDGEGFFAVETPRGERYTRNGAFQLNAGGELVTTEGYRVLGDGGPIVFQPQDRDITIGRDGVISVAGEARGQLRVAEFADRLRLRKDGTSTFAAPAGVAPVAGQSRVLQGAIEKSNVHGVVEMSRLIEISRAYTQIAQLTERQGDLRKTAIERLGDVPV